MKTRRITFNPNDAPLRWSMRYFTTDPMLPHGNRKYYVRLGDAQKAAAKDFMHTNRPQYVCEQHWDEEGNSLGHTVLDLIGQQ